MYKTVFHLLEKDKNYLFHFIFLLYFLGQRKHEIVMLFCTFHKFYKFQIFQKILSAISIFFRNMQILQETSVRSQISRKLQTFIEAILKYIFYQIHFIYFIYADCFCAFSVFFNFVLAQVAQGTFTNKFQIHWQKVLFFNSKIFSYSFE